MKSIFYVSYLIGAYLFLVGPVYGDITLCYEAGAPPECQYSMDFGEVEIYSQNVKTVKIKNDGSSGVTLTLEISSCSESSYSEFSFEEGGGCIKENLTIPPDGAVEVNIMYEPKSIEVHSATLTAEYGAGYDTSLSIEGQGVLPIIVFKEESLVFEGFLNQRIEKLVTVQNNGNSTVDGITIQLPDPASGKFTICGESQDDANCSVSQSIVSLSAGEEKVFYVVFLSDVAVENHEEKLKIKWAGYKDPLATLALEGTAMIPSIDVQPTPISVCKTDDNPMVTKLNLVHDGHIPFNGDIDLTMNNDDNSGRFWLCEDPSCDYPNTKISLSFGDVNDHKRYVWIRYERSSYGSDEAELLLNWGSYEVHDPITLKGRFQKDHCLDYTLIFPWLEWIKWLVIWLTIILIAWFSVRRFLSTTSSQRR